MYSLSRSLALLFSFLRANSRRLFLTCALILAGVFTLLVASHPAGYAGGSDSSGYLNSAQLLSKGLTTAPIRPVLAPTAPKLSTPYIYSPLGLKPKSDGSLVPTYPIGLPLQVIPLAWITGWAAAPLVTVGLNALAGLWLTFLLARCWALSRGWSLLGAVILAACPLYLMFSIQMMSDVPALTWATASILLAWKSRQRTSWSIGAGVALAIAVLIRPSNALLFIPVACCLGISWRRWLLFGLSGLPGAFLFFWYNKVSYGHPLETGYGDIWGLMQLNVWKSSLQNYATWIPALLTPLVLFAFGLPWLKSVPLPVRFALATWSVGYLVFYTFYYFTHEVWWYLRFILPCFPALIIASLLVARQLTSRFGLFSLASGPIAIVTSFTLLIGVLLNGRYWAKKHGVFNSSLDERQYADACAWANTHLPPGAVVASMQTSGALFYYTPFSVIRWDVITPRDFSTLAPAASARGGLYAITFPFENERAFQAMPGRWTLIGQIRHLEVRKYDHQ